LAERELRKSRESREKEQRKSREREQRGESKTRFRKMVYEFLNFLKDFPVNNKRFPVDFNFTAKQTPANNENILRKMFYIETNELKRIKSTNLNEGVYKFQ
jgi:hypothetical protein